ncbi:MAG: Lipid export ATP-binding/permease protein MsbA [Verrucomicrobiota bacterium]|nr:ABC transporter ATP-binding protein [Verrucomicrobiota bacterium]
MFRGRYKLYLPYLKGSRTLLFLSLVAAIVFAAANAIGLPFLIGKVLPAVFGDEASRAVPLLTWPKWLGGQPAFYLPKGHEVAFAVAFLPAVWLVRGLGEFFSTFLLNLAGLRVIEAVRRDVFAKLQQLHLGFFGKHSIGDLLSRLISDPNSVRLVLVDVSNDLIVQPLTLLFALGYVVMICFAHDQGYWFLACLLVVPASVFLVRGVAMRIQKRMRQGMESASDLNSIAVENLQSAREVRAYGLQGRESQRFNQASQEGLRIQGKLVRYEKALSPLVELTAAAGISAAIAVGAMNGFTLAELISLIVAFYFAYGPIKRLGNVASRLSMAAPGLVRLEEVIVAPVEVADAADARPLARVRGDLEMRGVSFRYGADPVLVDVTLKIPAGQSVALVGPSGAGKSTFVNLVPRFFDPQQGAILIDGHDLRAVRQGDLRANIALVSQEPVLFNESILENIRLGRPAATDAEVREAARLAGALEFIEAQPDGFLTKVGERGGRLSGGQRQRVSIARAFLKDAPLLILDEATSALDTDTERSIQQSLALLMKGRTTLIVAHRFSTIRDVDRVLVFDGGRIVADGTREAVYASSDLFRRLWDNQAKNLA